MGKKPSAIYRASELALAGESYSGILRRLKREGYKQAAAELGEISVRRELKRLACETDGGVGALFFVED